MGEKVAKRLHGRSVLSGKEIELTISDGRISGVRETGPTAGGNEAPDVRGESSVPFIGPGFFDIQVNGYHGSDYSLDDLNEAHLRSIDGYLAASGTTQYLPTIVTSPQKRLLKNLELMAGVFDRDRSHATVPRLRNYIWEQLACDELWAGMISDGFHLPESVVRVFARAKGLSRLILVSDAALLGGFEPGIYKWGNLDVEVFPDGHLGLPGTSMLAGAAHLLDWAVAHFHRFTGVPLGDTVRLCSENPARFMGAEGVTTSLRVGQPANLTLFTYPPAGRALRILRTLRLGEEVYAAAEG